ncbi:acyltransferase family protein [Flavitalea flava]
MRIGTALIKTGTNTLKDDFRKNNNFNLVRIYLSLSVVLYHIFELSGNPALGFLTRYVNVDRAVEAFFIISGYLVIKSYERSSSPKDFFGKRWRRIYPAYIFLILLCGLLGFLISRFPTAVYFNAPALYKYIFFNALFLNFIQPDLPGVFESNPFTAVNGSLWTLKIEVGYYILVPFLVYLWSKINRSFLCAMLFVLSAGFYTLMMGLYHHSSQEIYLFLARQLPGELLYFILGAGVAGIDHLPSFKRILSYIGLPCLAALFFLPGKAAGHLAIAGGQVVPSGLASGEKWGLAGNIRGLAGNIQELAIDISGLGAEALALGGAVFFVAFCIPAIPYPFKREDFSYGLYICHFPVIQVMVHYGLFNHLPFTGLVWSLVISVLLAVLSWFFVERPFLVKRRVKA